MGGGGGGGGNYERVGELAVRLRPQTNTWICFPVVASLIFDHVCKYPTDFTLLVFQVIMVSVFVTSGVEFE